MADVVLDAAGKSYRRVPYIAVAAGTVLSLHLGDVASAAAEYANTTPGSDSFTSSFDQMHLSTDLGNAFTLGGITFEVGAAPNPAEHVVKSNGSVQRAINGATGIGTEVGHLDAGAGELTLDQWPFGVLPNAVNFRGVAVAPINGIDSPFNTYAVTFRLATAPIRPSSFSLLGTLKDGTTFNVTANEDGVINATRVKGRINYQSGVVTVVFVTPTAPTGIEPVDISFLTIPGVSNVFIDLAKNDTLRYNAVAFTYLPLDADLLGIDPVRLPSDGRVPIFRAGGVAVIGDVKISSPVTVANTDTIDTGWTRLSRVRIVGHDGVVIVTGYTYDLESGVVTFTDVSGYSQPVTVEARQEDMALVRDAQIDGTISFTRPLTHNFAISAYVSSAFMTGDLHARVALLFDQLAWDGTTFADAVTGSAAVASYDTLNHPIDVTNDGASTERFGIQFTSTANQVRVIGEHVGVIFTGLITADIAPINPATSEPYFIIRKEGWGTGWVPGNLLRVNTVGALAPLWMVRTVKQGPESGEDYTFTLLARGDRDNPL